MYKFILASLILASLLPIPSSFVYTLHTKAAEKVFNTSNNIETKKNIDRKIPIIPKKLTANVFDFGKALYSVDVKSWEILEKKNENSSLPVASLTKLMTAYIVLKEMPSDQVITVPRLSNQSGDALVGLKEGEKLTVLSTLNGLLINSGSDAAQTLAIANSGSIKAFVDKMNRYAKELGLTKTHYTNPVGWDDQENYSSARDVASLARILLRNTTFSEIISKKAETIKTLEGRNINLSNTNKLLRSNGFVGVKTGYTPIAGECLVALNKQNEKEILTVIIGSSDRFGQTSALIDWIFTYFLW